MLNQYKFLDKLKQLDFIDEIWLFGSRARENHRDRSDIDLAIICPRASRSDWSKVLDIISEPDTLLHIDCIRFDELREGDRFKENIIKHKKILYKRNG